MNDQEQTPAPEPVQLNPDGFEVQKPTQDSVASDMVDDVDTAPGGDLVVVLDDEK